MFDDGCWSKEDYEASSEYTEYLAQYLLVPGQTNHGNGTRPCANQYIWCDVNEDGDRFECLTEGEDGGGETKSTAQERRQKRKERSPFIIGKRMNVFICLTLVSWFKCDLFAIVPFLSHLFLLK